MSRKYSLRKYRPKKRKLNVTKTINSKTFLILSSFIVFSIFSVFVLKNISKIKIPKSDFFSNIIQSISISANDTNIENSLKNILSDYKNSVFSNNLKKELDIKIKKEFPYLSDINIKFNPVTGGLKLESKIKKSIGIIRSDNSYIYLLEDGRFSPSSYNNDDELIEIIFDKKNTIDTNKTQLINKIYMNKEKFGFNFKIKIENEKVYIVSDNYQILWGSCSYLDEKLEKIKYILNDAKSKIDEPLYIDLRFFEEGKIIVSPQKTNLLK